MHALNFLKSFIKQEATSLRSGGTYFQYQYKPEKKSFWEGQDSVRRFITAVRIYKNSRCDLDVWFSIENVLSKKYYRPFSYTKSMDMYWKNISIINDRAELNKVKLIAQRLEEAGISKTIHYSKLYNAVNFFNHSYEEDWTFLKTTLAFTSLESLFSDTDKADIVYKIALRTAYFVHPKDSVKRKEIFEFIKRGYDIRSHFIHGSDTQKQTDKIMKSLGDERGVENYFFHDEFINELFEIVTKCLSKALLNKMYFDFFSNIKLLPKEESAFYTKLVL
jgi:hypothetical protein